jgi:hypothetical protein
VREPVQSAIHADRHCSNDVMVECGYMYPRFCDASV